MTKKAENASGHQPAGEEKRGILNEGILKKGYTPKADAEDAKLPLPKGGTAEVTTKAPKSGPEDGEG